MVNVLDITATERIVVGLDPPTLTSDVNDDGVVNVLDITAAEMAAL